MTEQSTSQIDELFWIASKIDCDEARDAFLQSACGNESIRHRVNELLAAKVHAHDYLEKPAAIVDPNELPQSTDTELIKVPEVIGPYKILEKIGEGGMGIVYVAEQTEPVHRKVAIKIIKPGMDTKEVVARFEAERQALAYMEHPNIARVIDAGVTETGSPYFVMELVRGISITEYCDQVRLTPRERLLLFTNVCEAVQHAHQKGVIHRDIKPSNVLVTQMGDKPVVKVIDFGLAKAISGQRLTDRSVYTGFMALIGTPVYMSPEQAGLSGMDVDTRADVYSLGVLLFELLTGTTPLDKNEIQEKAYEDLNKQIREVDAPKPSARISTLKDAQRITVALSRQTESKSLSQLLHGDLDRVVLKALEKDREYRYSTAKDLASDIDRFLADEPVLAVPPSPLYLARKYVRRHKASLMTVVAVFTLLVATTAYLFHARNEAIAAKREAEAATGNAFAARQDAERSEERRRREHYADSMCKVNLMMGARDRSPRSIARMLTHWIPHDGPSAEPDLREFAWRIHWTRLNRIAIKSVMGTSAASVSQAGNLLTADADGIKEWTKGGSSELRWRGDASHPETTLSPDGRWAVVPNENEQLDLVDVNKSQIVETIDGSRVRFTGGSQLLLVSSPGEKEAHGRVRVMRIRNLADDLMEIPNVKGGMVAVTGNGESHAYFSAPAGGMHIALDDQKWKCHYIHCIDYSPNGRLLAYGDRSGYVTLRIPGTEFKKVLPNGGCRVTSIAFSPDSKLIAVGTSEGSILIWDISAITRLRESTDETDVGLKGKESSNNRLASPNMTPVSRIRNIDAHIDRVVSLVFSSDAKTLCSRSTADCARLWDLTQKRSPLHFARAITAADTPHFGGVGGIDVRGRDGNVRVTKLLPLTYRNISGRVEVGDEIVRIIDEGRGVDDNATSGWNWYDVYHLINEGPVDSQVTIHLRNRAEPLVVQRVGHGFSQPLDIAFSSDDRQLFVADPRVGATALSWDTQELRPIKANPMSVACSANEIVFVDPVKLRVWDAAAATEQTQLYGPVNPDDKYGVAGGRVQISPVSRFLAFVTGFRPDSRKHLKVWNLEDLNEEPVIRKHSSIRGLAYTPDGKFLLLIGAGGQLLKYDTSTWTNPEEFNTGMTNKVIAVSPLGDLVAVGGPDGIGMFELTPNELKQHGHLLIDQYVSDLAFSRDGRTLVSCGIRTVLLDVLTGAELSTLDSDKRMRAVEFAHNGEALAAVGKAEEKSVVLGWRATSLAEIDSDPSTIRMVKDHQKDAPTQTRYRVPRSVIRRHSESRKGRPRNRKGVDLEHARSQANDASKRSAKPPVP